MLHLACERMPYWRHKNLGFKFADGTQLFMSTYVDNFLVISETARENTEMLDDAEQFLISEWGLRFGADSREVCPCAGALGVSLPLDPFKWPVKPVIRVLGVQVSNDGKSDHDFATAMSSCYRSLIKNLNRGLVRSSRQVKLRFLKTALRALLTWKWASWSYTNAFCERLDSLQRMCVSLLWPLEREFRESSEAFWDRQRRDSRALVRDVGVWSEEWGLAILSWDAHIKRNHADSWCLPILNFRNETWLATIRHAFDIQWPSLGRHRTSRTNSRCKRGGPPLKWGQGRDRAHAKVGYLQAF